MSRSDLEKEIMGTLGQVPDFFATMPDAALDREWADFKESRLGVTVLTALTAREKRHIGEGVASAIPWPCCTYFHRGVKRMMGSTDERLEAAGRRASETTKYGMRLHGQSTDLEESKKATDEISDHVSTKAEEAVPVAA